MRLPPASTGLRAVAIAAQTGADIAANSGRWVKLTKESARLVDKHGLRESSKTGMSTGVLKGVKGQAKGFLEFTKAPGAHLSNPAMLASAGGIMAQLVMQQAMDEITDYLARIDAKVDDVLRARKDSVLASMIGVGLVIDEAMTTREQVGLVNEVTWSKVQAAPMAIAETQAYALRQLDSLAEKLERSAKVKVLAETAEAAQSTVQEWLAVLARCFQLQDAIAVVELDRVLAVAPEDLNGHRLGLREARRDRLALITTTTERLLARIEAAGARANDRVLLHPTRSRTVVDAGNGITRKVDDFHGLLGVAEERPALEARRWSEAATEVRDQVLATSAEGVDAAKRLGGEGLGRAKAVKERTSRRIGNLPRRRRNGVDSG